MTLPTIVREIHVLSAITLLGAILFSYVFLRPALEKIPPAYSAVVAQKVGTVFTVLGLTCLGLLLATGLAQLSFAGHWDSLLDAQFYLGRYGRWLAAMLLGWIAILSASLVMTLALRPRLMQRLPLHPRPTQADVDKRRADQIAASALLDKLQLFNLIFGTLAAVAGVSLLAGGLL